MLQSFALTFHVFQRERPSQQQSSGFTRISSRSTVRTKHSEWVSTRCCRILQMGKESFLFAPFSVLNWYYHICQPFFFWICDFSDHWARLHGLSPLAEFQQAKHLFFLENGLLGYVSPQLICADVRVSTATVDTEISVNYGNTVVLSEWFTLTLSEKISSQETGVYITQLKLQNDTKPSTRQFFYYAVISPSYLRVFSASVWYVFNFLFIFLVESRRWIYTPTSL